MGFIKFKILKKKKFKSGFLKIMEFYILENVFPKTHGTFLLSYSFSHNIYVGFIS